MNNRGLIASPEAFAREKGAASWLYLCGEEFASMEGGMSYEDVQRAVPVSANVVSDPPTPLDLDPARKRTTPHGRSPTSCAPGSPTGSSSSPERSARQMTSQAARVEVFQRLHA